MCLCQPGWTRCPKGPNRRRNTTSGPLPVTSLAIGILLLFRAGTSSADESGAAEPWNATEALRDAHQSAAAAPQIVFVNYSDGSTALDSGADDAPTNRSSICPTNGETYPPWEGTETRARQLQNTLASLFGDVNLVLTAKRPGAGPYTMIVVGPKPVACTALGQGIALFDCDNRNPNNVGFDFSESGSVITIAQELGHTFGLGHNDVACDVMGASYATQPCIGGERRFVDEEAPIIGPYRCGSGVQNSYREMLRVLGPWPGGAHADPYDASCADLLEPKVEVAKPADGNRVDHDFEVEVAVEDDCGVRAVSISIPSIGRSNTQMVAPFRWGIGDVPDGFHEVVLTAVDTAGKTTEITIAVHVGTGPPTSDDGGCSTTTPVGTASLPTAVGVLLGIVSRKRRRGLEPGWPGVPRGGVSQCPSKAPRGDAPREARPC